MTKQSILGAGMLAGLSLLAGVKNVMAVDQDEPNKPQSQPPAEWTAFGEVPKTTCEDLRWQVPGGFSIIDESYISYQQKNQEIAGVYSHQFGCTAKDPVHGYCLYQDKNAATTCKLVAHKNALNLGRPDPSKIIATHSHEIVTPSLVIYDWKADGTSSGKVCAWSEDW